MDEPGGSLAGRESRLEAEAGASAEQAGQLNLPLWNSQNQKLDSAKVLNESEIQIILQNLFSEDYATRQKIISYLGVNQHVIVRPLVDMLVRNSNHDTVVFQVTYALESIGRSAVPVLLEALKKIREIKTPRDVAQMENISETLIRINDKSGAPVLADYLREIKSRIDEINLNVNRNNAQTSRDECWWSSELGRKMEFYQMARMKIHCLLGEMDSAVGFDDLLDLLGDGSKRVPGDIIEALAKIGNKRALAPLLRMYPVESEVSELGARYIKETCRAIIRREKVCRSDPFFDGLSGPEKDSLNKILSGYKNGNKH